MTLFQSSLELQFSSIPLLRKLYSRQREWETREVDMGKRPRSLWIPVIIVFLLLMGGFFIIPSHMAAADQTSGSKANDPVIENQIGGTSTDAIKTSLPSLAGNVLFWTMIAPANQKAALQAGIVDGAVSWEPYCSYALSDGTAKVLARSEDVMPNHPAGVVAVRSAFVTTQASQELVARVLRAQMEATDWILRTIREGTGSNYTLLVSMGSQICNLQTSVVQSALGHIEYGYSLTPAVKEGLANFTSMFADLGQISSLAGYYNVTDFVNGFTNSSYLAMAANLTPSSTVLGTVRLGCVNGDLQQLARVVAMNASLWGGKNLFEAWGVQVYTQPPYANGGSVMDGFAAGGIDMGYLDCAPAILKRINSNTSIEIVSSATADGSAILVRPGISSLDDLNFKTIATPGPASIEHLLLLQWAKLNGFQVYLTGTSTVPSAPQSLQASAGPAQVSLNWSYPSYDGGSEITNYKIYRGNTSDWETLLTTVGNVLNYTDAGLANGETYYYKVSAVNSMGEGPQSSEISAALAALPSAPQGLQASAGNSTVELNWTAPASDGGASITNYSIYRSYQSTQREGPLVYLATVGNVLNYTDSGLTNGYYCYYEVRASNSAGAGPPSTIATARPNMIPPAPINLAISNGTTEIRLTWSQGAGNYTVDTWNVYRGTSPDDMVIIANVPLAGGTQDGDGNVVGGVKYVYAVTAVNNIGESNRSNEVWGAIHNVPTAPLNLHTSNTSNAIILTWQTPFWNGDLAITNYTVYRSTSQGAYNWTVYVVLGNITVYSDKSVTPGVMYYYRVTATNMLGEGPQSSEAPNMVPMQVAGPTPSSPYLLPIMAIVLAVGVVVTALIMRRRK
jgi:fibronectin type 3 domain-containing protein